MDTARINPKHHILLNFIVFQTVTYRESNLGQFLSNEIIKHDFFNNTVPNVHHVLHCTFIYQLRCNVFLQSHISSCAHAFGC